MNNDNIRFRNSILGFIIGDALGVPYEFSSKELMNAHPAKEMIGFGTHPVPKGTWSDDSSMMLIIMKWLIDLNKKSVAINKIGYDELSDLKSLWKNWFHNGYMTPYKECFDIGYQTKITLLEPELYCKHSLDSDGQGNGALMRILPFAWLLTDDDDYNEVVEHVMLKTCEITHGNFVSNHFCRKFIRDVRNARGDRISMIDEIQQEPNSSGWVSDTYKCVMASSLKSLYFKDPIEAYKNAVLFAVNLGEDTDTVAAITGGLVGASFNSYCLPYEWEQCIPKLDMIENLITEFYNIYIHKEDIK